MPKSDYTAFHALAPLFEEVMERLSRRVEGEHYFDTLAGDVQFEFLYEFPSFCGERCRPTISPTKQIGSRHG